MADGSDLSRRGALGAIGLGAAGLAMGARAQEAEVADPPSVVTNPPRDFGPDGAPNVYFWDPDVIAVDDSFNGLAQPNAPIERLFTGTLWAEGPAWNAVGKFLVWSDIPNNRQLRYLSEDGHVSERFRYPSNNSNGNSFDHQGRQLSCEHLTRRVVRYELDGSITIIADEFEGQRFNSPNDVVAHTDGSYWFTDPPYGGQLYEGAPDAPGGPTNPDGLVNNRLGQPPEIGDAVREMDHGVYRVGTDGTVSRVVTQEQTPNPNGLAFSPDESLLYVASTGPGPGDGGVGGEGLIFVYDVANGEATNGRVFTDCMVDGIKCGPDGLAIDVYGNVWSSSNAGRNVGYSGVTVWSPEGTLLGRIRLPEICGNLCFGGPKRNRLFMAASQSLYSVYTATQGAGPA